MQSLLAKNTTREVIFQFVISVEIYIVHAVFC